MCKQRETRQQTRQINSVRSAEITPELTGAPRPTDGDGNVGWRGGGEKTVARPARKIGRDRKQNTARTRTHLNTGKKESNREPMPDMKHEKGDRRSLNGRGLLICGRHFVK